MCCLSIESLSGRFRSSINNRLEILTDGFE